MRFTRNTLAVAALATAATLALAGCTAPGGGGEAATGDPIVVAALSGLTFFPEAPQAVQAVFDDYNAAGGLDGHPIEYDVFDDKTDPAVSSTAAKDALASGAVALVGSSSLLDCAVNHTTWEQNDIISIQGTGVDPFCFATPNIAPTNTGPFFDLYSTLVNGSEDHGLTKVCGVFNFDDAAFQGAYQQAIDAWEAQTGGSMVYLDDTLTRGQASYAGNVAALKEQKCDAIAINEVGPAVTAFIGEASNQGLDTPFLVLTSCYSDEFAASIDYAGDVYLPAEFSPYTDASDSSNDDWKAVMEAHGVAKTSFAQGGYLAAKYFISILESVDGDVTRESVTAAARAMTTPVENPMTNTPWLFGAGDSHQANTSTWAMQIKANTSEWTSIGPWKASEGWVDTTVPSN